MTFNIKEYIKSGIIEKYCLRATSEAENKNLEMYCLEYPSIQKELIETQLLLENYLSQFESKAPLHGRQRILETIESEKFATATFDKETGLLNTFLNISKNSNVQHWKKLTEHLSPSADLNIQSQLLYKDSKKILAVVWINEFLPDEIHTNKIEEFFILEGACICQLGKEEIKMEKGSYLKIPLDVVHNIRVTSKETLKLILSKKKVA